MIGQIQFTRGNQEEGLRFMVTALNILHQIQAHEREHLTNHVKFFSRRMSREAFEQIVNAEVTDAILRMELLY
jgi:hypothetical protein